MEDENLITLLEFAVDKAVTALQQDQRFRPFAYGLGKNQEQIAFTTDIEDETLAYETLTNELKQAAKERRVNAIALLLDSPIPASFNFEGEQGIRIHIEHRDQMNEKLAGRFLYIPYQVLKKGSAVEVQLFQPRPVAFACEIFVN